MSYEEIHGIRNCGMVQKKTELKIPAPLSEIEFVRQMRRKEEVEMLRVVVPEQEVIEVIHMDDDDKDEEKEIVIHLDDDGNDHCKA